MRRGNHLVNILGKNFEGEYCGIFQSTISALASKEITQESVASIRRNAKINEFQSLKQNISA
jgi:hypothetical protein